LLTAYKSLNQKTKNNVLHVYVLSSLLTDIRCY